MGLRQVLFGLLFTLVFLASGFGVSAPWLTSIVVTTNGQPTTFTVGFFLIDTGSKDFGSTLQWCSKTNASNSECTAFQTSVLIMSIIFAVGALLSLVTGILQCKLPRAAFWLAPAAVTLQFAGGFGMAYRTLPLFKAHAIANSSTTSATSVTVGYSYAAFCALGGAVLCFIATVVYMALFRSTVESFSVDRNTTAATPAEPVS